MREEMTLPTLELKSSFLENISWVAPKVTREGEAVPGWKRGTQLPTHRSTRAGLGNTNPVPLPSPPPTSIAGAACTPARWSTP